jgi:hypothetical protein
MEKLQVIQEWLLYIKERPFKSFPIILLLFLVFWIVRPYISTFFSEKAKQHAVIPSSKKTTETKKVDKQGVRFKGNFNIQEDYFQIYDIEQEGDLNFRDSKGAGASGITLLRGEEGEGGNLNINNSQLGNVNENTIQKNVNIKDSSIENFNKNQIEKNQNTGNK